MKNIYAIAIYFDTWLTQRAKLTRNSRIGQRSFVPIQDYGQGQATL
ncbi:hypothetical protein [Richelia sinica]|nr:hypothetical protein [Richelia sinica]MBD2666039.1 hypothetical protein [Richelia sinica FACHB-800]